ncbi:MAG: response regulator transcription factor [Actinomycetota bacterium]
MLFAYMEPESAPGLSPRQSQVLVLIARGFDTAGIAREIGLSRSTVQVHTAKIFRRLRVSSRTEAVVAALRDGILDLHSILGSTDRAPDRSRS